MLIENGKIEGQDETAIIHENGEFNVLCGKTTITQLSLAMGKRIYAALGATKNPTLETWSFMENSNCHGTTNTLLFEPLDEETEILPCTGWNLSNDLLWERIADYYYRGRPKNSGFLPIVRKIKLAQDSRKTKHPFGRISIEKAHSFIVLGKTKGGEVIFEKEGYDAELPFRLRVIKEDTLRDYSMMC